MTTTKQTNQQKQQLVTPFSSQFSPQTNFLFKPKERSPFYQNDPISISKTL